VGAPPAAAGKAAAGGPATLTGLAPSQALVRTASLTVSTANVATAVSRATGIAQAAGGYVSAESSSESHSKHTRARVSIQFKVPPGAYQSTLSALAGLGVKQAETQRALDVTQTVADVTSRVTSAQAAIIQLRALLTRAGTVSDLLNVQNQINAEEASLEELQAQQRALTHETTYGTISLLLVTKTAPAIVHKKARGGFLGGLAAGWHGLVRAVSVLLTGAGAALPFLLLLVPLGYLAYRWLTRRSARRRPATGAGSPPAE
jgi:hypothetical protein